MFGRFLFIIHGLARIILVKIIKFLTKNKHCEAPLGDYEVKTAIALTVPTCVVWAIGSLQSVKCNPLPALVVIRQQTHWVCMECTTYHPGVKVHNA